MRDDDKPFIVAACLVLLAWLVSVGWLIYTIIDFLGRH